MLDILRFIFSGFFTWLGTTVMLFIVVAGIDSAIESAAEALGNILGRKR